MADLSFITYIMNATYTDLLMIFLDMCNLYYWWWGHYLASIIWSISVTLNPWMHMVLNDQTQPTRMSCSTYSVAVWFLMSLMEAYLTNRILFYVSWCRDESLLCQGLALNDDLQRVLARHESLSSGVAPLQLDKSKPATDKALVPVDSPLIDTGDTKQSDGG